MLTVDPSLLNSTAVNARLRLSFELDSSSQQLIAGGIDSYKIRIDLSSGQGVIDPSTVKVLGDGVNNALFFVDPSALAQGILSVAALAPTGQRLNASSEIASFELTQNKLAPLKFEVKEVQINGSNLLSGVTDRDLPVSFGETITRIIPSSAGGNGLYEAGGNLVIAPLGLTVGQTLLDGSFTPLKEVNGSVFSQDAINGYSPSSIGTYLNQFRVVFKSDSPLSNGSFGFKTLDFNQSTGVAVTATPAGLPVAPSGGQSSPPSSSLTPETLEAGERLTFDQYKNLLPNVKTQDEVGQQKVGENYLLDFSLSDGTPYTKLIGRSDGGVNASVSQTPVNLDMVIPANISVSIFGPTQDQSASITPTYFKGLVDLAFPSATDYSRSLKAAIDALSATKTSSSVLKVITPEGAANNESLQVTGNPGQSELLALNMLASTEIQQVELNNIEHALLVGDGMLAQSGNAAVFFAGDGANQILAGGPGNDYLYSGGGFDSLIGGPGGDTFHVTRKGGVTIQDFESIDKLRFSFLGVNSLLDLVGRITAVDEQPNSVSYVFDSELVLTLIGYSLYDPYPESMFILD